MTRAVNLPTAGSTPWLRYSFALAVTLLALGLRVAVQSWTENVSPFLFFMPAVMLSAWFGGLGPGLISTAAGAVAADYFLLPPYYTFAPSESSFMRVLVFVLVGTQISWLSGALHKANLDLEHRVRQRTAELDFQKTLLESQVQASKDGMLALSEDGEVIFSNGRFREVWGLTPAEAAAPPDGLRSSIRGKTADHVDVLADGGGQPDPPLIGDGSYQVLLKDGRVVERYSAPIVAGGGASYGRVWFFRDVTDRRRLEKELLEAGERERQSIGQDLHDDLCQQLTGIACLARVLRQRLSARSAEEAADAAKILDLVQQATACCRDLSKGLQPVTLEPDGLVSSLQDLCAGIEDVFQVPCRFRGDAAAIAWPDAAVPTHLYRIAQEAITNAVKHARAQNISVDLIFAGERLILAVEDDGVGIPDVLSGDGIGLRTMDHRARMVGGTLSIERGTDGGTTVTCSMRRPAADAAQDRAPGAAPDAAPPQRHHSDRARAHV